MRKTVAYVLSSLDGVTQDPQTFVFDYFDDEMIAQMKAIIDAQDAVLLGRVTYDEWSQYWPTSTHEPFASFINDTPKYVVSSTLREARWKNTTVARDVAATIAELKAAPGRDIGVHGSIQLVRSLLQANLLDELRLATFPTIVSRGAHLGEGLEMPRPLELANVTRTRKGVLVSTYLAAKSKTAT